MAVAVNTATESIRQPIHAVLLLLGIGLQALNPIVSAYTLGEDNLLLQELGLSSIFLVGMFLASFTAALALGDEIRRQTVLTVLSKPIDRTTLLLGKFLGISFVLGCAWWIWSLTFLLALRHEVIMTARDSIDPPVLVFGLGGLTLSILEAFYANWRNRRSFPARLNRNLISIAPIATLLAFSLNRSWGWQSPTSEWDGQISMALLLLFEGMLLLGAVGLTASTRLGTMATLAVTSLVFVLGMVGDAIAGDSLLRYAIPNLQLLWVSEGLIRGAEVTGSLFIAATVWALTYTSALLAFAAALFRNRDVS